MVLFVVQNSKVQCQVVLQVFQMRIRRLQRELNRSVSDFPQFGLNGQITAAEEEQNLSGRNYTQTEKEIENYELQDIRLNRRIAYRDICAISH
ncbi:MAG: hypothetical protein WA667_17075 [Candidatus Nitrosopolaris sp.]